MTRNVPSDESRHLLEGVRPAGNWSPASVTLVPSPHVVGDSLVLATIADDVALHDYQISTIKEFKTERVNEQYQQRSYLTTLVETHGTHHSLRTDRALQLPAGAGTGTTEEERGDHFKFGFHFGKLALH